MKDTSKEKEIAKDTAILLAKKMLKQDRFQHSLNVANQAVHLAKKYHNDVEKAYLAGVLHDICKNMTKEEQLQWIKKSDIILESTLYKQPPVWHGFAGAVYLKKQLGIHDEDVINAVRYHTTAREGMCELEQIIYLADFTSEDRDYPDVAVMRQTVEASLQDGMRKALIYSMGNLVSEGKPVCLDTCRAYNQYLD